MICGAIAFYRYGTAAMRDSCELGRPLFNRRNVAMNWENQQVVVLGGSSGIGLSPVSWLAAARANVTAVGRNQDKLDKALASFGGHGRVAGEALDCNDRAALE